MGSSFQDQVDSGAAPSATTEGVVAEPVTHPRRFAVLTTGAQHDPLSHSIFSCFGKLCTERLAILKLTACFFTLVDEKRFRN